METFEKAGKAAGEFIEKTIEVIEEIAAKAVDVVDTLEEMTMDLPMNAKKHMAHMGGAKGKQGAKKA